MVLPNRRRFEQLVGGLFLLAIVNFVAILLTGGMSVTVGSFELSQYHLWVPLFSLLASAAAKLWLKARRTGAPISATLMSGKFLLLIVVLVYTVNARALESGDTVPARYLPLSILRELNFDLNEFAFLYENKHPYFLLKTNGHIVSAYPPWPSLLAVPIYLLPTLGGISPHSLLLPELEKLAATAITALSALVLFLALRLITEEKKAWLIALIYGLGTSSFSTSSQALWQHGPSQLFLALMIYFLVRGEEAPRYAGYAGFALASAIICRPANVLLGLPVGAYMLHKKPDKVIDFLMAMLPAAFLFGTYNVYYFGSPLITGFAAETVTPRSLWQSSSYLLRTPLVDGLLGVLVSPGRGLLVYSPILACSMIGIVMVWIKPGNVLLKYLSLAPLAFIILAAKWGMWWGGHCYGPRLLADITPILSVYLYPVFTTIPKAGVLKGVCIAVFVTFSTLSISIHTLGVFADGSWNVSPGNIDEHPERLWSWGEAPPIYYGTTVFTRMKEALQSPIHNLLMKSIAPTR